MNLKIPSLGAFCLNSRGYCLNGRYYFFRLVLQVSHEFELKLNDRVFSAFTARCRSWLRDLAKVPDYRITRMGYVYNLQIDSGGISSDQYRAEG